MAQEMLPLHAGALLGREIGIRGLTLGRWLTGVAPERRASDITLVSTMPVGLSTEFDVAGAYPLDQIANAVQHLNAPGRIGTVIVKM